MAATEIDGLSFPSSDGLPGQVLFTNGSGQLGFRNHERPEQWDFRSNGSIVMSGEYDLLDYLALPFRMSQIIPRAASGSGTVSMLRNGTATPYMNMPFGGATPVTVFASHHDFLVGDRLSFFLSITSGPIENFVLSVVANG